MFSCNAAIVRDKHIQVGQILQSVRILLKCNFTGKHGDIRKPASSRQCMEIRQTGPANGHLGRVSSNASRRGMIRWVIEVVMDLSR